MKSFDDKSVSCCFEKAILVQKFCKIVNIFQIFLASESLFQAAESVEHTELPLGNQRLEKNDKSTQHFLILFSLVVFTKIL